MCVQTRPNKRALERQDDRQTGGRYCRCCLRCGPRCLFLPHWRLCRLGPNASEPAFYFRSLSFFFFRLPSELTQSELKEKKINSWKKNSISNVSRALRVNEIGMELNYGTPSPTIYFEPRLWPGQTGRHIAVLIFLIFGAGFLAINIYCVHNARQEVIHTPAPRRTSSVSFITESCLKLDRV